MFSWSQSSSFQKAPNLTWISPTIVLLLLVPCQSDLEVSPFTVISSLEPSLKALCLSRFSRRYEHWIIVHDHADLPPISLHVSFAFQFIAPIYTLFYIAEQFSSLALLGSDFEPPNIIIFCQTMSPLPQLRLLTEAHGCSSSLPQTRLPHSVSETGREQCVYFITADLYSGL